MCVYMKITKDEYELPLAVADTVKELSAMTGDTVNTINSAMSHTKHNPEKYPRCRFVKVEID